MGPCCSVPSSSEDIDNRVPAFQEPIEPILAAKPPPKEAVDFRSVKLSEIPIDSVAQTNTVDGSVEKNTGEVRAQVAGLRSAVRLLEDVPDVDKAMLESVVSRLESVTLRLERLEAGGARTSTAPAAPPAPSPVTSNASSSSTSASVLAFESLVASHMTPLAAKAGEIGGEVKEVTLLLEAAFKQERGVLDVMSKCKKPVDQSALQDVFKSLAEAVGAVGAMAEGKRTSAFNNLKVVAEASQALFWVASDAALGMSLPAPMVDESWQSAEFYANKVLREMKGVDDKQVEWVKMLKALFMELKAFVKQHHTTGPAWNAAGKDVGGLGNASAAPPPPPPPPPAGSLLQPKGSASVSGSGMSAVFKELNQGEGVTSSLKKVTDDMKSKNRADRSGAVPATTSKAAAAAPAPSGPAASKAVKTPKCALENGRKWVIENQVENKTIVLKAEECNTRQTVYIYNCAKSVIQIQGKVNSIAMDKCTRTGLVFEEVVAACELVNSQSVEVQCSKLVPTIAVDNVEGCQIYLSESSMHATITTAKSSEVNILVPGASKDDDMVESPLPEQFSSTYENGKWVTVPVLHSAG
eukprot:CAMPEP_0114264414 /NCGR_PEP_ID=MMETSP0058-20121206/23187_1 /TAXON_ID=36894 /ORGANISM="Pyramimonas parkeae, CCMP726" /LENGTH=580 /DNA_ID=CAMNT_0001381073 /DNA_START=115 /DNA_END=1857 /DNA_ORIENTATION=-